MVRNDHIHIHTGQWSTTAQWHRKRANIRTQVCMSMCAGVPERCPEPRVLAPGTLKCPPACLRKPSNASPGTHSHDQTSNGARERFFLFPFLFYLSSFPHVCVCVGNPICCPAKINGKYASPASCWRGYTLQLWHDTRTVRAEDGWRAMLEFPSL